MCLQCSINKDDINSLEQAAASFFKQSKLSVVFFSDIKTLHDLSKEFWYIAHVFLINFLEYVS